MARLLEILDEKDVSPVWLSWSARVPIDHLQSVLAGGEPLSPFYARRLAVVLGVPAEEITAEAPASSDTPDTVESRITEIKRRKNINKT